MSEGLLARKAQRAMFPAYGWVGLVLIGVFWIANWVLEGPRTMWAFFPLWVGYCLTVDAINVALYGTSLITRSWRRYIGLFAVSAPVWWLFEVLNWRVRNWHYEGRELVNDWQYFLIASINFSIVIPAVFGTSELFAGMPFIRRMKRGLVIGADRRTTLAFFAAGWVMLGLMMAWPRLFFPFLWLSVYFVLEPINAWLGNHSLVDHTRKGDWRPVVSLWLGALTTGFFWEMWNYFSFPKWVYTVPGVDALHIFEMPLLGYGGYLPFALELYAIYHLLLRFAGVRERGYVHLDRGNEEQIEGAAEY